MNSQVSINNYDVHHIESKVTEADAPLNFLTPLSFHLSATITLRLPTAIQCQSGYQGEIDPFVTIIFFGLMLLVTL